MTKASGVSESRESRSLGSLGVLGVSGVSESQTMNCRRIICHRIEIFTPRTWTPSPLSVCPTNPVQRHIFVVKGVFVK